ncbi:MAG: hypothetical protein ABIW76_13185 [Fibrobacteria bacterium]
MAAVILTAETEKAILYRILAAADEPYSDKDQLVRDLKTALTFCEAGAPGVGGILRTVLKRLSAEAKTPSAEEVLCSA